MSGSGCGTLRGMAERLYPATFTERKRTVFLQEIRKGQTVAGAAARAGVGRQTIYDHVNSDPVFAGQIEKARGQAEAALVDAITKSAHTGDQVTTPGGTVIVKPGDWRASAWLLEHHPHTRERYAAINKAQIGGDPDNPTPVPVEVTTDGMTGVERLGAVVTVLQRAGVLPIPEPGEAILLDAPPEPKNGTSEPADP